MKRTRKKSTHYKTASVRESRVVLFGRNNDTELIESKRRVELTRAAEVTPRPSYDSGLGPCGKHVCSCKEICKKEYLGAALV